jgi:hypothetical protein
VGEIEKKERFFKWVDPHPGGTTCTLVVYSKLVEELGQAKADDWLICSFATEINEREYKILKMIFFIK